MKILQRGENPVVHGHTTSQLAKLLGDLPVPDNVRNEFLRSAVGDDTSHRDLDGSIVLDPAYEQPLWEAVRAESPLLSRFLIPQPPLEALAGKRSPESQRWGDFLLTSPLLPSSVLIELDGAQHSQARAVDAERDRLITMSGVAVFRCAGSAALDPDSDLRRRLRASAVPHDGQGVPQLTSALHAPSLVAKLGVAIAALVRDGRLRPAESWDLHVEEPYGLARAALVDLFDLLEGIQQVWGLHVLPDRVILAGDVVWAGSDPGAYTHDASRLHARIVVEPFTAAHASLPACQHDEACVVVRGAYVPCDLAWLDPSDHSRRDVSRGASLGAGLERVVRAIFGYDGFRPGQRTAVERVLAGEDACVLLPTGAGKSLIYQLAGLLRPGLTVIVDPITSLIDDQERRLHEDGITRVAALHMRRFTSRADAARVVEEITSGGSFFAFVTPERLQTAQFRDALAAIAAIELINLVVVDEAHCVSEWGHDFRAAYLNVGRNLRRLSRGLDDVVPPLVALTGTASPAVLRDVRRELEWPGNAFHVDRADDFDRANLRYQVLAASESQFFATIARTVAERLPSELTIDASDLTRPDGRDTQSGIVFVPHVNGRFGITKIRETVRAGLATAGVQSGNAIGLYAGSAPKNWPGGEIGWAQQRAAAAKAFLQDEVPILVSTKAFGMGVDKPNIRWTLHVGFPSSIEAFAQEAGRAGRDGGESVCFLVSSTVQDDPATQIALDPLVTHEQRIAAAARIPASDLKRQLFFLRNNFVGEHQELGAATAMLRQLWPAGSGGRVEIPRNTARDAPSASDQEKALYRLSMVGVVDDYTVEYGSKKFTVDLSEFSRESLDRSLLAFFDRVEPGRIAERRRELSLAPENLMERSLHHLRQVVGTVYRVVEPSRVHALAEMFRLARLGAVSDSSESDEKVRAAIRNYLSDGPVAGVLLRIASAQSIDVEVVIAAIEGTGVDDPGELAGAAARQLQAYPDHPMLRIARALGEALAVAPDKAVVRANMTAGFDRLAAYGVDEVGAGRIFRWLHDKLRREYDGRGWRMTHHAWLAWTDADLPDDPLVSLEDALLKDATTGELDAEEIRVILRRRVMRMASALLPEAPPVPAHD